MRKRNMLVSHPEQSSSTPVLKLYGYNVVATDYNKLKAMTAILVGETSSGMPKAKALTLALRAAAACLFHFRDEIQDIT
jgi:hypothetical protein